MRVWRLARPAYAALDGAGGLFSDGRWHSKGIPIIYCAESVPGALVEVLVHMEVDVEDLPAYQLLAIDAPPAVDLDLSTLPKGWLSDVKESRKIGDEWLRLGNVSVLRVPSAIMPHTWNVLINPKLVPGLTPAKSERFEFDPRLLGGD